MNRRTSALLIASVLVSPVILASTSADAIQTSASQTRTAVTASAAPLACDTQIVGVNAQRKLLFRTVHNRDLVSTKVTGQRLPFDPTGMEFYDVQPIRNGYNLSVTAVGANSRPHVITVKQLNGRRTLTFTTKRMLNKSFSPQLYAGSGGFYVFGASARGTIQRWTTFRNDQGDLSFGKPRTVLQGLRGIKTLAFANRAKVHGVLSDVLYATNRQGGIYQVSVPTSARGRTRVKTIVLSGFEGTTDLSLSNCNGRATSLSIVAINADDDKATWFTLTDQFAARSSNLTNRGLVAEAADWKLHATF